MEARIAQKNKKDTLGHLQSNRSSNISIAKSERNGQEKEKQNSNAENMLVNHQHDRWTKLAPPKEIEAKY